MRILLLISTLFSFHLYSQETSISTTQLPSSTILKKFIPSQIGYFSDFTGPSIGNSSDPVDSQGNISEGSLSTWNQISFGWKINNNIRFVANPRFVINHNSQEEGKEFEAVDAVFGIAGLWYKSGKFSFAGGLNTIIPSLRVEDTIEEKLLLNPGGFNSVSYQLTPKLSLGSWIWARYKVYEDGRPEGEDIFSMFVAPITTYTINDKLSTSVFYRINGNSFDDGVIEWNQDESLNIMTSIQINKMLTIEPIITMFRETNFEPSKSNFNMWLSGRLF